MSTRPSTDKVIDAFVARFNACAHHTTDACEVPPALRRGDVDTEGQVEWRITSVPSAPWVVELEARLPGRLPPSFRSLINRYAFPAFDIGPVRLFANTGEAELYEELRSRIFADKVMAGVLLAQGYVQFGWATGFWYDPVCFHLNSRRGGGECPLVHLDHEAVLQHDQIQVVKHVAPSFLDLLEGALSGPQAPTSH